MLVYGKKKILLYLLKIKVELMGKFNVKMINLNFYLILKNFYVFMLELF